MNKPREKDYTQDMVRDLTAAQQNVETVLAEQVGELHSTLKTAAGQIAGVLWWLSTRSAK